MTAPAPRNHPAEVAHPAPAAASVAVPEVGLCDVRGPLVFYPDRGSWPLLCQFPHGHGGDHESEDGARWGDLTRPEPVVAPLPSEAVRETLVRDVLKALRTAWQDDYSTRTVAEGVTDAMLAAGYRPVLEDDEDTVRVLDRLRNWIDPTTDTYQPYAVDIGEDVILAVGVDDLRVLLDGTR